MGSVGLSCRRVWHRPRRGRGYAPTGWACGPASTPVAGGAVEPGRKSPSGKVPIQQNQASTVPGDCHAHAVPLLMRPTEKRERDFICWETGGQGVDEDWLDLLARGAACFPKSKTVVPKRPRRNALEGLAVDTTVILAADSKVHDSRRLAADIAESIPRLRSIVVDGATHHTMPMSPATELNDALVNALSAQ